MIDLKNLIEKYPECLDSATKFKSYMMDLYPGSTNKARIRILADIVDCGIAVEIKNGKTDSISISKFCKTMENQYGYSKKLVKECTEMFLIAFGFSVNKSSINEKNTPKENETVIENNNQIISVNKYGYTFICNPDDYEIKDGTLVSYKGYDSFITLPKEVTSIGEKAFSYMAVVKGHRIEGIYIPESVTIIDDYAFVGCSKLRLILLPDSITSIGEEAFVETDYYKNNYNWRNGILYIDNHLIAIDKTKQGFCKIKKGVKTIANGACDRCFNITSVKLPDDLKIIGKSAFHSCINLKTINIPDSVEFIGEGAFWNCRNLKNIDIPNTVKFIGEFAFRDCNNLKSINIPEDISSIEESTFSYCNKIISIAIPDGITSIGKDAFAWCDNLNTISIPNSVKCIGEGAFCGCDNLKSVNIPAKVSSIGRCTFLGCDKLNDITIPDNIKSIGELAFSDCISLKSIVIPRKVKDIGKRAFYACKNLTNIVIPDSVTNIDEDAFSLCDKLKTVYFYSEEQKNKFANNFARNVKLIVKPE